MTFQTRSGLDKAIPSQPKRPVCALIEQYFGRMPPSSPLIVDNVERLRRQLDLLGIEQIVGLGDIPPGASLLLLRGDVLFELATLKTMALRVGGGAHIDDTLAAVHVEAGDAAAALSKFRREEISGWAPFQIKFARLGKFKPSGPLNPLALFMRRRSAVIAKAAILPNDAALSPAKGRDGAGDPARDPIASVWARSPGLDPLVRTRKIFALQKEAFDAFGLKPSAWQGIGFMLLLMMISFGALGWGWVGAVTGFIAAGCFDLAERAADLKELRLSKSSSALCVQALVIACLWLFVVFAAGAGATAQMPALVLILLPLAFIMAQASAGRASFARDAAFGVYLHAILAALSVVALSMPLVSLVFSAGALLLLLTVTLRSCLVAIGDVFAARVAAPS